MSRVTAFLMAPPVKRTILPSQELPGRRARNGSGQPDELAALLPFYCVSSCLHLRRQQHPVWISDPFTIRHRCKLFNCPTCTDAIVATFKWTRFTAALRHIRLNVTHKLISPVRLYSPRILITAPTRRPNLICCGRAPTTFLSRLLWGLFGGFWLG